MNNFLSAPSILSISTPNLGIGLSKSTEKNVVSLISKASSDSKFYSISPSVFEDFKAGNSVFNTNMFSFNTNSKKYVEVLEENLRNRLKPTDNLNPEIGDHVVTPVTIQSKQVSNDIDSWAAPIQTFEGRVINLIKGQSMDVILVDKTGGMPDHELNIDLQWVTDQDKMLVKRGAIFYLSLYKQRSQGGSIRNSEEIRFRRLPSWSQSSIDKIKSKAEELLASNFKIAALDNN